MWNEFRPLTLSAVARELDIPPFEVVRLLIASGKDRSELTLDRDEIRALSTFAGIESWWSGPPADHDVPARQAVLQTTLKRLIDDGYIGDKRTRQDNLWRGLPSPLRAFLIEALEILVEDYDALQVRADASGLQISVRQGALAQVRAMSEGTNIPEEIACKWT